MRELSGEGRAKAALLGKAPCQADFVRIQADDAAIPSFHRWLEEAVETLRGSGGSLPAAPVQFLHVVEGGGALAGVMAASRDEVGREFPLAALLPLPRADLSHQFSALPAALDGFFAAARDLLAEAGGLDAAALAERVATLPAPDEAATVRAREEVDRALERATVADLAAAFAPDGHWYALRTLALACEPERKGQPAKGGPITLDCPVGEKLVPSIWLELLARRANWRTSPSFLWSGARLLVTLGSPPGSLLTWLHKPPANAMKLWPLATSSASAIANARSALAPHLGNLESPDVPLKSVWSAFGGMP